MKHTNAIQKAIKTAGSQAVLASRIGVSQGLVSQWNCGEAITTKHFAAIERETGISVQELLADELAKAAAKSVPS